MAEHYGHTPKAPTHRTDAERLDYLQAMLLECRYTGLAVCRWSKTGRGMRLHEHHKGLPSIREAIDAAMEAEDA